MFSVSQHADKKLRYCDVNKSPGTLKKTYTVFGLNSAISHKLRKDLSVFIYRTSMQNKVNHS